MSALVQWTLQQQPRDAIVNCGDVLAMVTACRSARLGEFTNSAPGHSDDSGEKVVG